MTTQPTEADHHCGVDCPACSAFSEAVKVLGGIAESMQKMLDDGTFERLGREAALQREKAVLDAFLGTDKLRQQARGNPPPQSWHDEPSVFDD